MSLSRSCQRCQQPLPDHLTDGTCPSCGFAVGKTGETPRGSDTPRDRDQDFLVGADPNLTASHIPTTVLEELPYKKAMPLFPDIPNHTDFEVIGRGGMGTVYRAIQRPIDRTVAVKVVNHYIADSSMRERYINEVRAHARVRHPGIVPVFEVGECSHGPYFTMEYHPGGTLAQRLKAGGLDDREAVRIVADAADAVHAAHEEGIIHRDIKPSNILVDDAGYVRVTDFGLAKHAAGDDITQHGVIVGTFAYMSPEQAAGDPSKVGAAADVYCLGSTLFQLVTGRVAHPGRGANPANPANVKRIVDDPTPVPRSLRRDLCPTLDAIVQKCMARAPSERYATAALFARDLRCWLNGESTIAKPLTHGQKVRRYLHRHRVAVALILMLPLLAAAAVAIERALDPREKAKRALRRGETVVLVGETGFPKWYDWKQSKSNVRNSVIGDGSPGFETLSHALLELLDDPIVDSYRFSIDLRHAEYDDTDDILIGMFLGYENLPTDNGIEIERWISGNYSERYSSAVKRNPRLMKEHGLRIDEELAVHYPGDVRRASSMYDRHRFRPEGNRATHNVWRTIVAEVDPAGIAFYFRKSPGEKLEPVASYTARQIENKVMGFNSGGALVGTSITGYLWTPRRPLGLLASHSSIAFRNATIEPIPAGAFGRANPQE